jgi:hypothetical protein
MTKKRLGADARITHYGPASTYADYRGRIYVSSRATFALSNLLAMRRSPYTVIGIAGNHDCQRFAINQIKLSLSPFP